MNIKLIIILIAAFSWIGRDDYTPEYYGMYEAPIQKLLKKKLKISNYKIDFLNTIKGSNILLEHYRILDESSESTYELYCGPIVTCDLGGCTASKFIKSNSNSKEYFDFLLIQNEKQEIREMKILNYLSDYGYEVTSRSYLKKFIGHEVCQFGTAEVEVDAVSGATISSDAIMMCLDEICLSQNE